MLISYGPLCQGRLCPLAGLLLINARQWDAMGIHKTFKSDGGDCKLMIRQRENGKQQAIMDRLQAYFDVWEAERFTGKLVLSVNVHKGRPAKLESVETKKTEIPLS